MRNGVIGYDPLIISFDKEDLFLLQDTQGLKHLKSAVSLSFFPSDGYNTISAKSNLRMRSTKFEDAVAACKLLLETFWSL